MIFYVLLRGRWVMRTMMKKRDYAGCGGHREYTTQVYKPWVMMEKAMWWEKVYKESRIKTVKRWIIRNRERQ
jgi:hypothetical protein